MLSGLMNGAINQEIARRLGIWHMSVDLYRGRLMQKLEVRNYAIPMCHTPPLRKAAEWPSEAACWSSPAARCHPS